jgi:DNA-binding NtrC family response regulator
MPTTIISSGLNVALLRVRNAIIQQAGYAVVTSKESAMVLEMAGKDHVGAVVLCSSIPVHLRANLARELKKVRPNLPVIAIYSDGEEEQLRPIADYLVPSIHGIAQPLVEAIVKAAGEPEELTELNAG